MMGYDGDYMDYLDDQDRSEDLAAAADLARKDQKENPDLAAERERLADEIVSLLSSDGLLLALGYDVHLMRNRGDPLPGPSDVLDRLLTMARPPAPQTYPSNIEDLEELPF